MACRVFNLCGRDPARILAHSTAKRPPEVDGWGYLEAHPDHFDMK
jgi:hypothetical protein